MDFGYPQSTERRILKEYVYHKNLKTTSFNKIDRYITQESQKLEAPRPPMAVTNAVSWRSEGIKVLKKI